MASQHLNTSGIDQYLDLDVALGRVRRNIINGSFPNHLDAALIKEFPNEIKSRVEELLGDSTMEWANGVTRVFDLPKSDGLVRPITYIDIDIAVAYQALVDAASQGVEEYISSEFADRVLSFRLNSASSLAMFNSSEEAYKRFISIQHRQSEPDAYSHCLRLDIANYFERIYHHKLQQLLERRGVPGAISAAIGSLLRKFSNGDSHGIPQGHWASDYLGNAYLLYLDEFLQAKNIYAVRYVDDYRIFCNSEREAKSILKECGGMLRELGLNIQPQKTSIVTTDELNPELKPITEKYAELRDRIGWSINRHYIFEELEEEETVFSDDDIRSFENLWTEAIDQEDKRTAILNFTLSGLTEAASPTAEQYILSNLAEFPHLGLMFTKYLISLDFKPSTADRIISFIESEECIHESQQMWLLQYFRRTTESIRPYIGRLKALLNDSNRHPIVRCLLSEIIAFKGSDADGEYIRRLFTNEGDSRLRRHLLLGYRLLPVTERNYAISYLPPSDWTLQLVGRLVKSGVRLLDTD